MSRGKSTKGQSNGREIVWEGEQHWAHSTDISFFSWKYAGLLLSRRGKSNRNSFSDLKVNKYFLSSGRG